MRELYEACGTARVKSRQKGSPGEAGGVENDEKSSLPRSSPGLPGEDHSNEYDSGDPWSRGPLEYAFFSRFFLLVNDNKTNSSLPKGSQGLPPRAP